MQNKLRNLHLHGLYDMSYPIHVQLILKVNLPQAVGCEIFEG